MDPRLNPFSPGAGAAPPALVGRDDLIDSYEILLDRLRAGYAERSMLITGLRGVGKTVLLSQFAERAPDLLWIPIEAEVAPDFPFHQKIVALARKALLQSSPRARWSARLVRAGEVLKSFSLTFGSDGSVTAGLDVQPRQGAGDSGFLDDDLGDLFVAIGEAVRELDTGIVLLFDELQFLGRRELESLIVALQVVAKKRLPVTLVGAGLPQLPALTGKARSYAERLFRFESIGRLSETETFEALSSPVECLGVRFGKGALERVYEHTDGYPYFVQEYGRALWNLSENSVILSTDVEVAAREVSAMLDASFFSVRTDSLSSDQLSVLRGMADAGDGAVPLHDIVETVRLDSGEHEQVLEELALRSMIYSPRFGSYDFAVPHFRRYLRRQYPFVEGRVSCA